MIFDGIPEKGLYWIGIKKDLGRWRWDSTHLPVRAHNIYMSKNTLKPTWPPTNENNLQQYFHWWGQATKHV